MKYSVLTILAIGLLASCGSKDLKEEAKEAFITELKASDEYAANDIEIESTEVTYSEDSLLIFKANIKAIDSPAHSKNYNLECAYVIGSDETVTLITDLKNNDDIRTQFRKYNADLKDKLIKEGLGTELVTEEDNPRYDFFLRSWCLESYHLTRIAKALNSLK